MSSPLSRGFLRAASLVLACSLLFGASGCSKKEAPQPVYTANPAPLPESFAAAFDAYRPEGTRGWTFVQETVTREHQMVEKHDATLPEFKRWTLLSKNGHPPTEAETKEYLDLLARRPRSDSAPNVRDQVLRDSWQPAGVTPEGHELYRFRLKPGGEDDHSAAFMLVTFEFDPKTQAIAAVELAAEKPFKPTFGVAVNEARTRVSYHLPTGTTPVLIREIQVKVRGKAFWIRSLDQDMTVSYRDYMLPTEAK